MESEDGAITTKDGRYYQEMVREETFHAGKTAGMSDEEARSMANGGVSGWDGGKEFIGGAKGLLEGFGAKTIYDRFNRPASHHPVTNNTKGAANPASSAIDPASIQSSLNSDNPIISQAAHASNSARQELSGIFNKGSAAIARDEIGQRLVDGGHQGLIPISRSR